MAADDAAAAVPLDVLVEAYRTGRAHLIALEAVLLRRGFVKCLKCQRLHPEVSPSLTNCLRSV